jgi:hypothetical protein
MNYKVISLADTAIGSHHGEGCVYPNQDQLPEGGGEDAGRELRLRAGSGH